MTKYIKSLKHTVDSVLSESLVDDAAELVGIEQDDAADRVKGLSFANYLELGNAIDVEDVETAREILSTVAPIKEAGGMIGSPESQVGQRLTNWLDKNIKQIARDIMRSVRRSDHKKSVDEWINKISTEVFDSDAFLGIRATNAEWALIDAYNRAPEYYSNLIFTNIINSYKSMAHYKDELGINEADNPYAAPKAAPATTSIPPQSAVSSIDALAQPADTSTDVDAEENQRKDVSDLMVGDDIEVIDIDGDPAAVTVKNPRGPGETIIVQTSKGEEHIIKKVAVSGTPIMAEGVLDTHVNVEYRDPEGDFIVVHAAPAGYWPVGKGAYAKQIDQLSFDNLDDAIEHAQLSLSSLSEETPPGMEDWVMKRKPEFKERYGKKWEKVLYATAWKQHNMKNEEYKIDIDALQEQFEAGIAETGDVRNTYLVTFKNHKNAPDWMTYYEPAHFYAADKEGALRKAVEYIGKKEIEYVQPRSAKLVKKFYAIGGPNMDQEVLVDSEGLDPDLRLKIQKMITPHGDADMDANEWLLLIKYAFEDLDMKFNPVVANDVLNDFGMEQLAEDDITEEGSFHFFVEPYGEGRGADVMDSKGGLHDHFDDPALARQVAAELNAKYGKDKDGKSIGEARNASNTEHSGAKKGRGGYYGRKQDAKSDSNKKRRANDKKSLVDEGKVETIIGAERRQAEKNIEKKLNDAFAGKTVVLYSLIKRPGHSRAWQDITVTINRVSFGLNDADGPVFVTTEGDYLHTHPDHEVKIIDGDIERIRELAGISETASGGSTGAGSVAVGAVAMGSFGVGGSKLIRREISSNPSIYGKTTSKPKLKDRTKESTTEDGLGRKKK